MIWILLKSFLQIGSISFGGYMSMVMHIRRKFVEEEELLSEDDFSKGLALASILPGPVAVNVSVYCGYLLAGLTGALVSLVAVLFPSFLLMLGLFYSLDFANALVRLDVLTFMVSGVAFGLILAAGIQHTRKHCSGDITGVVFLVSFILLFLLKSYLTILVLLVLWSLAAQFSKRTINITAPPTNPSSKGVGYGLFIALIIIFGGSLLLASSFFVAQVFLQFSKISLTTFGGAYVVVPLMKSVLVDQLSWISSADLLLGISLGQLTPGPLLISAAFFGQKVGGIAGAFVATAGMFVPTAMVMLISTQHLARISGSAFISRAMLFIHPFVAALIVYAAVNILITSYTGATQAWFFIWWAVCFLLVYFYAVKPIWLIGLSLAFGLLFLIL